MLYERNKIFFLWEWAPPGGSEGGARLQDYEEDCVVCSVYIVQLTYTSLLPSYTGDLKS